MNTKEHYNLTQKPFFKILTNRFTLITIFFLLWLIFFDTYSFFEHQEIDKEIKKLKDNKEYYTSEIENDMKQISKLLKMEEVEKYAREKYYMKRENEDIYIIDIPSDSTSINEEN